MLWDSRVALVVKTFPANVRDIRYSCSVPGLGRSPGGGHGNSLQYSCLKNPMDRGTWQTTVHRVAKSQTRWKQLNLHAHPVLYSRLSLVIYSIQAVHMCQWQSPTSSHPPFSLESQMFFSLYLCLYVCFVNKITYTNFFQIPHIYGNIQYLFLSFQLK